MGVERGCAIMSVRKSRRDASSSVSGFLGFSELSRWFLSLCMSSR